ncbi:MAG: hypothetical protein RLZZ519_3415 [Bacteroidota bacterium]
MALEVTLAPGVEIGFGRFWITSNPLQDKPQPKDSCLHLQTKLIKLHNSLVNFQNRQGLRVLANALCMEASFSIIASRAMRK